MNERVMIAMSGGVDSSVAAYILRERGYDCAGVTMKLFSNEDVGEERESACCSVSDAEDARSVANRLGIPHFVFNMTDDFEKTVMDKFAAEYLAGRTPNPCIDCNRFVKFEALLARARAAGYDFIATGHYARVRREENGRYGLYRAADAAKDQSYVLYPMTQDQLAHTMFPLGGHTKGETREIAASMGFRNAKKPESQDICFVPGGDYAGFIERWTGQAARPGDFVDEDGRTIGRHGGHVRYTIGQRRGLGMGFGRRIFVLGKNPASNAVTLGGEEGLYSDMLYASQVNLITVEKLNGPVRLAAMTRYRQKPFPVTVSAAGSDIIKVEFDSPQRAVAAGQAVVFYDGGAVFGGGTIAEVRKK